MTKKKKVIIIGPPSSKYKIKIIKASHTVVDEKGKVLYRRK